MSKRKYTHRYLCVLWVWFSHKAICINRYVTFYHYKRIHIVWNPIKCRTSSGYFGREVPPRLMPLEGLVRALIANRTGLGGITGWHHTSRHCTPGSLFHSCLDFKVGEKSIDLLQSIQIKLNSDHLLVPIGAIQSPLSWITQLVIWLSWLVEN